MPPPPALCALPPLALPLRLPLCGSVVHLLTNLFDEVRSTLPSFQLFWPTHKTKKEEGEEGQSKSVEKERERVEREKERYSRGIAVAGLPGSCSSCRQHLEAVVAASNIGSSLTINESHYSADASSRTAPASPCGMQRGQLCGTCHRLPLLATHLTINNNNQRDLCCKSRRRLSQAC